ncbi:hypothetical protein C0J52_07123 [Blattella germanica]|nr:hypothetical protein C0J52_07123 [Blattella germanica]
MRTHYKKCTSTGPVNLETPVNNSETLKSPVAEGNGATSPSSSLGHSDVTVNSAAVITPPHSDESSCGSSVIPRNAIEAQPA